MGKEKKSIQKNEGDSGERKKFALESLTNFSKHLMLLLVAVIAFASAPALNDTPRLIQACFAIGVVFAVVSFICGHESILNVIDSYIKEDADGCLLEENEAINIGTIKSTKKWVEWQYWLALLSIVLISISVVSSTFIDKEETTRNCALIEKAVDNSKSKTEKFEKYDKAKHNKKK